MQTEIPVSEDLTLASVRRRSQSFLSYLFWVCVVLCLLWAAEGVAWAQVSSLQDAPRTATAGPRR